MAIPLRTSCHSSGAVMAQVVTFHVLWAGVLQIPSPAYWSSLIVQVVALSFVLKSTLLKTALVLLRCA
ncbi:hypothetical protein BC835DRAFT_1319502 [Cytidiella melzeri]|nr:hypothetical protein BC835DRAFT_1319502 [Cytidiella melzeri]